jgi:hypothetical protein
MIRPSGKMKRKGCGNLIAGQRVNFACGRSRIADRMDRAALRRFWKIAHRQRAAALREERVNAAQGLVMACNVA